MRGLAGGVRAPVFSGYLIVVLSAGTLGTNEILLRSSREGLAVSEQLGRGFSTNGDFSAFIDDVPFSFLNKWVMPTKGPINSCSTRFAGSSTWMTVEDAGIPKMFARLVRIVRRPGRAAGDESRRADFRSESNAARRRRRRLARPADPAHLPADAGGDFPRMRFAARRGVLAVGAVATAARAVRRRRALV